MKEKSVYYLIVADVAIGILALLMLFVRAATGIYLFKLIAFALFTGSVMLLCVIAWLLLFILIGMFITEEINNGLK